ncbi:GNAT family N-acetyltransferase [Pelomonas sp. KK5]|uniref:GNAT family N-acetyltransferase n=1 Tax=Pelomonas sp. KK5 TaxID=1855730 RepID=UPI00097BB985|nr:GNAT family N-acetyltransferase [Pelomonas sp. KK5]
MSKDYTLRPAEPRDVPAIVSLVAELAEFEHLSHLMELSEDKLHRHLFGERPVIEALVVDTPDGQVCAYAICFTNFSTFLGKPGLYLEDLYVQPAHRRAGLGKRVLTRLAQIAVERDYGRFEWSVLDWNENAIRFYESMGAVVMTDWRICRVAGEALAKFA